MFQCDSGLLLVKRNLLLLYIGIAVLILIHHPFYHFVGYNGFLYDLLAILNLHLGIEPAHRVDLQQGSHFTETVTAALFDADAFVMGLFFQNHRTFQSLFLHQFFHSVINL